MKFLTETVENVQVDIQESALGIKDYYITGIFMQSGIKNKNGRVYPPEVLAREMNRYTQDQIANKRSVGELNHPSGPQINLDKVSHMITSLWVEGQNIYGKAKILNTPQGQIVKTLIDEGVQLGVSTRGFGTVKEVAGTKIVQSDFRLATIDIVQDPSCQSAYVSTLMESKEFFVDDAGNIRERDPSIVVESSTSTSEAPAVIIEEAEEDEAKWEAGEFKDKATKAKSAGDIAGYHSNMISHHKAMSDWYDQKGNESSADDHDNKVSFHKKKLSKLNEDLIVEGFVKYNPDDYVASTEISKFDGGHRPVVADKEGKPIHISQYSYPEKDHALEAAEMYRNNYGKIHDDRLSTKLMNHWKQKHSVFEDVLLEKFESALNEISKTTLKSYLNKGYKDFRKHERDFLNTYDNRYNDYDTEGESFRKFNNRDSGTQLAKKKLKDKESLNEISKATLGSYIKKASKEVETRTTDSASFTSAAERHLDQASKLDKHAKFKDANDSRKAADQYYRYSDKEAVKANKRQKGISKAVDKLTKE